MPLNITGATPQTPIIGSHSALAKTNILVTITKTRKVATLNKSFRFSIAV